MGRTCTIALMLVNGEKSLYILRFLLGAAEAGFFPGIILYLTDWFPNRWRGRCASLSLPSVPIAGIIGGPLSGWITSGFHEIQGLRGWQWPFPLEGIPAMTLGLLSLAVLTDKPEQAHWLSPACVAHAVFAIAAASQAATGGTKSALWRAHAQSAPAVVGGCRHMDRNAPSPCE